MFRRIMTEEAAKLGLSLPDEAPVAGMEIHFRLLQKWNRRLNLTALRDDRQIIRRHFLESIQADPYLEDSGTLLDFGSGNGFPGVPLRLLRPGVRLLTIDAAEKKCGFLKELYRALGWPVSDVVQRRVDRRNDLQDLGTFRFITVRGVRLPPELVRCLMDGLDRGGRLILFAGEGDIPALRDAVAPDGLLASRPLIGLDRACLAVIRRQDVPRGTTG